MKIKVLFIIWSYSYGGGAEKILTQLVNNMDKNIYDIAIQEYYHTDIKKENTNPYIHILPPIIDSKKTNRIKRIFYNLFIYLWPSFLRKKIPNNYDIEIAFNYQIPSFLLHKNKKSICWVHGAPIDLKSNKYKRLLQKKAYQKTNAIVPIANMTKNTLLDIFPFFANKIKMIYNGYDFEMMDRLAYEKTDIKLEKNSLLFCGRLTEAKNPLELLHVIELLKKKDVNVHLYLLGDGPLKNRIKEVSRQCNIEDRIHVLGYVNNPYPIIVQAKLLVMLSKGEGFPTIFVEGMHFGKPFISSYVGGCDELSQNGANGIIVNDINECANEVYAILLNDKIYYEMSDSCKKYINKLTIKKQVQETEKLITNVLNEDK